MESAEKQSCNPLEVLPKKRDDLEHFWTSVENVQKSHQNEDVHRHQLATDLNSRVNFYWSQKRRPYRYGL